MKRAKTERKSAKKPAKTILTVAFDVEAPHAYTTVTCRFNKISTKKWPKILRDIAELIDTGQLSAEIERELRLIDGVDVDSILRKCSPRASKK